MKINELSAQSAAINSNGSNNSHLILNYAVDSEADPITYKVSLRNAGKAIANDLALIGYTTNKGLIKYTIDNNAYASSSLGQYIDSTDRSVLNAAITNIAYDTTNKKFTKTVFGTTTSDIVSVATIKTDLGLGTAAGKDIPTTGDASTTQVVMGNDSRLTNSRPASDVSAWAKASTKPTYTASEVGALPSSTVIPTSVSQLTNDAGYLTSFTETDPTVPSWAKAESKPTYTANEVGAAPIASPAFTGSISLNRKADTTIGADSIAVGYHNAANGDYSAALGRDTEANGTSSFAGGENTIAAGGEEFVIGCNNELPAAEWQAETEYAQNDYVVYENKLYYCASAHTSAATFAEDSGWYHAKKHLFTIGNGNNSSAKSNAFVVDLQGNGHFKGELYIGCNANSSGGNKVIAIPEPPTTDGTYTLQATVSSGEITYNWI